MLTVQLYSSLCLRLHTSNVALRIKLRRSYDFDLRHTHQGQPTLRQPTLVTVLRCLNNLRSLKTPPNRPSFGAMASFFQELWESIFTPGPTPTLLVATNVTFAALQIVLAALLFATYSVHFVVLSVLCGGLWAAINWFARELKVHQQQEEEKTRRALVARPPPPAAAGSSDDSETEVEAATSTASLRRALPVPTNKPAAAVSTEVEAAEARGELKHRAIEETPSPSQGQKSTVSTEDEWEKVSENENEKDK
ncbi:Pkr1-domain-containing protein [Parathielavia appendiculata]|uniref:Pkr1-domain-containing protein n=1 Tax=Parathielavia appendiculata TaxID=2587402 RepID=A0AAN6U620_9PEZI|nr:Pkr1-domain-containing protein [Parathielavia appendiculata]